VNLVPCKLVTIIAEDELESRIVDNILSLGAKGYTVARVHGAGLHRPRLDEWEGENVLIETLVSTDVADQIVRSVSEKYFASFGVTVFVTDAQVVRAEKLR